MKKMNTLVDLALAQINNSLNEKPARLPASVKEKRRRLKAIKARGFYRETTTKKERQMSILKDIISQHGNVTKDQCRELAKYFPDATLIIKWGGLPREKSRARFIAERIEVVEESGQDYCREVFFPADAFNAIESALTS